MPAWEGEGGGSTSLLQGSPCSKQGEQAQRAQSCLQQVKITLWSLLQSWEALLQGES